MPFVRPASLPLLLLGCAPTIGDPGDKDATTTTTGTTDTDDTDPGDTDDPDPHDTGDDDVEVLPPARAAPVLEPAPQLFVDPLTVSVSADPDVGVVMACVGTPERACALEPATSLTLDGSGVVYARVDVDGSEGALTATPYVRVDAEVAAFTSNLPVLVAWTDDARDDLWENTPVALLTFDATDARADLTAPADLARRARIRIRGSSSSGLSKKNYDLEVWDGATDDDDPVALLGLPEDADWVLHAPSYYDDALVRNALGYQLSRDIGRYAPRTAFSEMFVLTSARTLRMSDYAGVYVVTEEIERGGDRVDVARLDADDVAWPEVTGGYVFKRDRTGDDGEGLWAGSGGGSFDFSVPIIPVDPELSELEDEQRAFLTQELDALGYALAASDGVDPFSGRAWSEIIDVDSFIDHHILAVVVKNPDAFRLSGYFHKDREEPIFAGPIWDLDRTAGSIDSRARDPFRWDATNETGDTTPLFTYGWYGPLFDDPDFRLRYWARWQTLLAGPLAPEAVAAHIADMRSTLEEAGPRNNVRWDAPSWEAEQDRLAAWYDDRLRWIDACIDLHDDPRDCAGAH